ncbi:MAG: site-specific integrase [Bacteroidetes bacterium]|nr:site-specific integrase [Bacteroidota bacterium]
MAKFKVKLDTRRQLKDGTYPLIIRIHSGSSRRDINLKTSVCKEEFDEATQRVVKHPNKKEINQKITQTLVQLQGTALKIELAEEQATAGKIKTTVVKPVVKMDVIQFAQKIVLDLRESKKYGNALFYQSAISALKTYTGRQTIQFSEVSYEFLQKLESKMLAGGLTVNGIAMYMRTIRAIYNRAIKEKLIDRANYPYESYRIKMEATAKRNISKEDIKAIVAMDIERDSPAWHARNFFMLSFNLFGASFVDLATLKYTDIIKGRISYRRKKTHKLYNIKLTSTAWELIQYYYSPERTYILPVVPESSAGDPELERRHIQQATKTVNKYLKQIGTALNIGHLTTYVSRHSAATIAKRMGYSKDLIAEALGHEFGNKVTGIYLDTFDQEVIDEMILSVSKI